MLKRDKQPGGDELYTGWMEIPTWPGQKNIKLKATEASPEKAMQSITKQAGSLLKNPIIQALVPPQAKAALAVVTKLVGKKAIKTVKKAAKKFVKSLKFW